MRDGVTNISLHRLGDGDHHRQHDCGGTVGYVEEEVMEELKPCPFCGGEAELLIVPDKQAKWIIRCRKCFTNNGTFVSDHDAVEAWNRRANDEQSGSD